MIREIAQIKIDPAKRGEFLAAVAKAVPIFQAAKGCKSMRLEKVIEEDATYRLHVKWETLEAHTVDFRESEGFQQWRGLVGGFFAEPPSVDHSEVVVEGF